MSDISAAAILNQKHMSLALLVLAICLSLLILVYRTHRIPRYVFRKLLHIVAFSIVSVMLAFADSWISVCIASVIIIAALSPILKWFSRKSYYPDFFVEKEPGEVLMSFVMLFTMLSIVCAIGWGAFGRRDLAISAILMWGVGDAAAALVGIPFGKHKARISIHLGSRTIELTDGKKSVEGSMANCAAAALSGFVVMMLCSMPFTSALLLAALGGAASALTELVTPSEYDTFSVPIVVLAVLLIFSRIL